MMKRTLNDKDQKNLSPPPVRRKVESTTTKKAVASFFTPASKKEPDLITWRTVDNSLLVGRYKGPPPRRRKIAAFDFDSTLIRTSSGNVFGKDPSDWKWWDASVPGKLRSLHDEGYLVVILSNQAGISLKSDPKKVKSDQKRLSDFKTKVGYVLAQLDIPLSIYAATSKDKYRKPRSGMWVELLEDYDLDVGERPDLELSFFVGDAGGRVAKAGVKADHSSSDRDLATNIGISYTTPEEFFLNKDPQPFVRTLDHLLYLQAPEAMGDQSTGPDLSVFKVSNKQDIVLFCGSPGAGKSTFYWEILKPLGYERVNQDILKSRERCLKKAAEYLADGKSVAVDNTNADIDTRNKWVQLAAKSKLPIRCVCFMTPIEVCKHNDAVRALNMALFNPEKREMLPGMAFTGFTSRYQEPKLVEGFQEIVQIPFKFRGNEEQLRVWSKYWI